jgi:hypothetical protein
MPKGIDFIWAIEFLVDQERQSANRKREHDLEAVVREYLLPYGKEDSIANGTQALQRLRSFRDEDFAHVTQIAGSLFPGLKSIPLSASEELLRKVMEEVRVASRATFSDRTRLSTIVGVLRPFEPGYFETEGPRVPSTQLAELTSVASEVQNTDINTERDFETWQEKVLAGFEKNQEALAFELSEKPLYRRSDTNTRMYLRNFNDWMLQQERFTNLLDAIHSGEAAHFGERRLFMANRRGARLSMGPSDRNAGERLLSKWVTSGNDKPVSLNVTLRTTSGPEALTATKEWTQLPGNSAAVRDWVYVMLNIWGSAAQEFGFKAQTKVSTESGVAELEFVAQTADEAGTKIMQFVAASL